MTNQQHPITPPPELVQQWVDSYFGGRISQSEFHKDLATRAALWGADQELDKCCEYLRNSELCDQFFYKVFRTARRPKPPSLAGEALEAQQRLWNGKSTHDDWHLIRRALEKLQQLEDQQ